MISWVLFLTGCRQGVVSEIDTDQVDTAQVTSVETTDEEVQVDDDAIFDVNPDDLPQGPQPCRAPVLGWADEVIDGDTMWIEADSGWESVRFIGVNSPEMNWNNGDPDCYAQEAHEFAREILEKRWVWISFDVTCEDAYGRTLGYVHVGTHEQDFFQRRLLRGGYAWAYAWEGTDTYSGVFAQDQARAMSEDQGLWGNCP